MERISIHNLYKKNYLLASAFILLLTLTLLIALSLGYKLTSAFMQSKFFADKSEVLDQTIKPYNEMVYKRIRELSYYQGFLDSSSAKDFVNENFSSYRFVKDVYFFDLEISNYHISDGLSVDSFFAGIKNIYAFNPGGYNGFEMRRVDHASDEFTRLNNSMINNVIKLATYVQTADTTHELSPEESFKIFYSISDNQIGYINELHRDDIARYKQIMYNDSLPDVSYNQDMILVNLDPYALPIKNVTPKLYEHISIQPVVFDSLANETGYHITDIALPGAFSDYKLYFISSHKHILSHVLKMFRPLAVIVTIVYALLILMAFLLFRNLKTNQRMFKLQYDFINNLTHEFKTPVSVIKIAGNNIRSSAGMTEREQQHYGRILDEEADKLNDLLTKLLSFTQIESKSIKIKKEPINLEVFCQNLVDAYQLKYPDFHVDYTISGITHIESDKVLLGSVFTNLIDNAYKYSLPGRKHLFIDIRRLRRNLVFRFIDQGIGIDKKEQENVFRRFYKVENEFNRQGSVGIGLAFCKEVINYMDGNISVKSEKGKGSEFIIILPYK